MNDLIKLDLMKYYERTCLTQDVVMLPEHAHQERQTKDSFESNHSLSLLIMKDFRGEILKAVQSVLAALRAVGYYVNPTFFPDPLFACLFVGRNASIENFLSSHSDSYRRNT